jgi:hypothetical protein
MALNAAPFLRCETLAIIAAIAPTLDRVVSGVLRRCCAVHSVTSPDEYELEGLRDVLLA